MFFGYSDRADRNDDGRVDSWEAAEELYAYDSIMGTNISGFCPENDEDGFDEDEEDLDDEYEGEDEDEDEDEDSDEW